MLIEHSQQKIIHAITYFASNTKHFGKVKVYKLLYFLDFEHFAEIGKSVTGLVYSAWPMGPVPVYLHEQVDIALQNSGETPFFSGTIQFSTKSLRGGKGEMLEIKSMISFDPTWFSKRELRIMARVATEFQDAKADKMIASSHLEYQPWYKVYQINGDRQAAIPYSLALRSQDREEMLGYIAEHQVILDHFTKI
jgi:uncharacterized phage-associated protein